METIKSEISATPSHRQLSSESGELYSKSVTLTEGSGFQDICMHHEILSPGKRASKPHRHSKKEECIYVLEGELVSNEGGSQQLLKKGDFFSFHPAVRDLHFVENRSSLDCVYLILSSNPSDDEVVTS